MVLAAGCAAKGPSRDALVPGRVAASDLPRQTEVQVAEEDLLALVEGNTAFALALYDQLRAEDGNLIFSPHSISLALAMTFAGARGNTEVQMAEVLRFDLSQERLHPAWNALDLELARRGEDVDPEEGTEFTLRLANALWGQHDYDFRQEYLDLLAQNYGTGLRLVDYTSDPDAVRLEINRWVEEQTEDRIKDLLAEDSLDELVRLVLVNAIYMNASWMMQFPERLTQDASFYLPGDVEVQVPTMRQTDRFRHTVASDYAAVELPYVGNEVAMLVIMPDDLEAFEESLDSATLQRIVADLEHGTVDLSLPRFRAETSVALADILERMGMTDAFVYQTADLSGMDGTRELYIGAVQHQAFIAVDEEGTEAAAATVVIVATESMPIDIVEITIDRPFLFGIRDIETGAILFWGRILDPRG
jgi:serpin B